LLGRSDPLPGDPIGQTENAEAEPLGGCRKRATQVVPPWLGRLRAAAERRPSQFCIPQYARPTRVTNITAPSAWAPKKAART